MDAAAWITTARTYAREKDDGSRETWEDIVNRCLVGMQEVADMAGYRRFTDDEIDEIRWLLYDRRMMVSGRAMWQLGTRTVRDIGAASLNNCWFVVLRTLEHLCFLMDCLMLGGGVGYRCKVPIKTHIRRVDLQFGYGYQVADSREGWVEALRILLHAHTFVRNEPLGFSLEKLRPKGARINGFGGKSSGPEALRGLLIEVHAYLQAHVGRTLDKYMLHDLACIVAGVVVAGNVRRSAMLSLGEANDERFLTLKRWQDDWGNSRNMPSYYQYANNTVLCDHIQTLAPQFWEHFEPVNGQAIGECYGLFNERLSRQVGRLGESMPDPDVEGLNPCGEQPLPNREPCNLGNLILPRFEDMDQMKRAACLLLRFNKLVALAPYHNGVGERTHRFCRVGLSVDGICTTPMRISWLAQVYEALRIEDYRLARTEGMPLSIRYTTLKPSGTQALIAECTAGASTAFAPFHIKRMRIATSDDLLPRLQEAGYPTYQLNETTSIVEIPMRAPEGAICATQDTAVAQLERIRELQRVWSDSAVSITVYYRAEELPAIRDWLNRYYRNCIKSVSFTLHSGHGFEHAPLEEISGAEYARRMSELRAVVGVPSADCAGRCELPGR